MRIRDARTGGLRDLRRPRGGLLRVCVHTSATGTPHDQGDLRALLIADVLTRTVELDGLQVVSAWTAGDASCEDHDRELAGAGARAGIHPATVRTEPSGVRYALGGPVDVHVVAAAADPPRDDDGVRVAVAPAPTWPGARAPGADADPEAADPMAVRLALLGTPYDRTAGLSPAALEAAAAELTGWRERVAHWARATSQPVHAVSAKEVVAAFHDGLDSPAALAALRRLAADPQVADGAKFETFLFADRWLGLELPRDIGKA
ncbi:hypothetical protein [Streptomyces sp. ICBB 8177]|uniref:hypothetical protein n=1 Tax=Streptomyces sp. ICBB 8177 TaxID=563922 RepID=UPI000D67A778|nr:hypothetical protein [Streptomyces sp. ICBB 8177]PWI41648.1 hypothetical protein CK485_22625 [Streptomyces sp. ICBB 8177]